MLYVNFVVLECFTLSCTMHGLWALDAPALIITFPRKPRLELEMALGIFARSPKSAQCLQITRNSNLVRPYLPHHLPLSMHRLSGEMAQKLAIENTSG